MIWSEQKDNVSDCYFCQTSIKGINHKSRHTVNYPNLQSAQRPIPHRDDLPVPQPPVNTDDVIDEENVSENSDSDPTFEPSTSNTAPHFVNQNDLNDLIGSALSFPECSSNNDNDGNKNYDCDSGNDDGYANSNGNLDNGNNDGNGNNNNGNNGNGDNSNGNNGNGNNNNGNGDNNNKNNGNGDNKSKDNNNKPKPKCISGKGTGLGRLLGDALTGVRLLVDVGGALDATVSGLGGVVKVLGDNLASKFII
ncbi:unnamed protein product [Diatraea saccharalis]|uniref:Uncharacterized protein n=1 Tax=Diatraea saccharalis TaxID=40085 RepID=A0A9N9R5H7_9NEOP|nr:unnamed protein product [Diatraea saccharalis]